MPTSPGPPAPTPPGADATPGEVVHWIFDVINSHQASALRAVWTEDTRERTPTATHRGGQDLQAYFERLFAAVPDLTMTIVATAEQDDTVFVRWILSGTHTGAPLEGIDPTGARVSLDGVEEFTVRDGTVASSFVIYDQMQLAQQLGLVPTEGSRLDVALKRGFNLLAGLRRRSGH